MRRTDAALSIGKHFLVGGYAIFRKQPANLRGGFELVSVAVDYVEPFQVNCAGNVALAPGFPGCCCRPTSPSLRTSRSPNPDSLQAAFSSSTLTITDSFSGE